MEYRPGMQFFESKPLRLLLSGLVFVLICDILALIWLRIRSSKAFSEDPSPFPSLDEALETFVAHLPDGDDDAG